MLTLYMRPGCQYCAKVLLAAAELGIELDERNINNLAVEAELLEKGGKRQVPYLFDPATGTGLYESDAIVEHLHASFTEIT